MNTGINKQRIKNEIQSALHTDTELFAVFGFGSFFRSLVFNDIDILIVASEEAKCLLSTYQKVNKKLECLSKIINIKIDLTFLTYSEFTEKPLLEHDSLVRLLPYQTR